jgi:predicted phosphodiesterase
MRVAALYDIHRMLDALEAVLAEVEREDVDAVLLGGDVVGGPQPAEVLARLRGVERDRVVSGHTHMQFDRDVDGIRWVNAGSVGMACEGEVAAFWALLGPDVSFRKTPFDVEAAIEAVLASGWPDAQGFVEENLRAAVTRAEATEFFERRAVELGQRG